MNGNKRRNSKCFFRCMETSGERVNASPDAWKQAEKQ